MASEQKVSIPLTAEERATIARLCDWAERKSSSPSADVVEAHKALLRRIAAKMGSKA